MYMTPIYIAENEASPAKRTATGRQRQTGLWFSIAIVLATLLLLPVAGTEWKAIPAFIPAYQTAVILSHGIAAYLVFSHFMGSRCVALLHLGCGCLYTAVILVAQFLSFPGMIAPQGVLPGGAQTTIWLWAMWHVGPSVGMLLYVVSEWRRPGRQADHPGREARRAIGVLALVMVASIAAVTVFHDYLPVLDVGGDFRRINSTGIGPVIEILTGIALVLLWRVTKFRTVLQVWIAVALVALLCDNAITMAGGTRLSLGWYVGRFYALASATVLLFGYLREINRVYLRTAAQVEELAVSNVVLEAKVVESGAKFDKARQDHLTGLPGRALYLELAEALRAQSVAQEQSIAVLFIDLDGFKKVNDTLGHDRGDQVLVAAANALRSTLREKDIAGRLGGDEFAVCLLAPRDSVEAVASSIAGRIVSSIGKIGDGIGCSIGVALCSTGCEDFNCALRQADEAMYTAKRAGKNQYVIYGREHPDGESQWTPHNATGCAC